MGLYSHLILTYITHLIQFNILTQNFNTMIHLKFNGKFTDNFLFVRGAGLSGAHWLDDESWTKIVKNIKYVSKALAFSKIKVIGFDLLIVNTVVMEI